MSTRTSTTSIRDGLRAALEDPLQQELDLERFDWDASAAIIGDACVRAA